MTLSHPVAGAAGVGVTVGPTAADDGGSVGGPGEPGAGVDGVPEVEGPGEPAIGVRNVISAVRPDSLTAVNSPLSRSPIAKSRSIHPR